MQVVSTRKFIKVYGEKLKSSTEYLVMKSWTKRLNCFSEQSKISMFWSVLKLDFLDQNSWSHSRFLHFNFTFSSWEHPRRNFLKSFRNIFKVSVWSTFWLIHKLNFGLQINEILPRRNNMLQVESWNELWECPRGCQTYSFNEVTSPPCSPLNMLLRLTTFLQMSLCKFSAEKFCLALMKLITLSQHYKLSRLLLITDFDFANFSCFSFCFKKLPE